jgi:hypothetical protein
MLVGYTPDCASCIPSVGSCVDRGLSSNTLGAVRQFEWRRENTGAMWLWTLLWGSPRGARMVQGNSDTSKVQSCRCDRGQHPWSLHTSVSGERRSFLNGSVANAHSLWWGRGGRRIQNRGHPWRVIWDDMRCWVRIVFCRGLLEDFLKIAEDLDIDACM